MQTQTEKPVRTNRSRERGRAPAALEDNHRSATEVAAALRELESRLAAVEAALTVERRRAAEARREADEAKRKAAEAQQALAERRDVAEKQTHGPKPGTDLANLPTTMFGLTPFVGWRMADVAAASRQMIGQAGRQPALIFKWYANYLLEMSRVLAGQSTREPDPKDKRFIDTTWKSNAWYRMVLQAYLAWRDSLNGIVNDLDLAQQDAARARFVLSLFTDALAPTNSMLGNPAAIKTLFETGGTSLQRGMAHMIEDLVNNGGLPAQVNMKAFTVGKDLGISPGAVVFKTDMFELIQYKPTTPQVHSRPTLIIPPQVNKFYVMDLSPGKSLVQHLLNSGIQVFIVSWRNPSPEHRDWGFDAYDQAILQAIDVVRSIADSADVNILGACLAGMALATLLSYLATHGDRRVHSATFMVTVFDLGVQSTMTLFSTRETLEAAKLMPRMKGVVEGKDLARVFAWLRPNDLIWNYWVNNYLNGNEPPAFDVLFWNNDTTRLPAKVHAEMLDLFESNPFMHPSTLEVLGAPVDLSKVTIDTYLVAGITDHIVPWHACYGATQVLGGKRRFILSNSGHIQAILNPPGNPKATYFVNSRYPHDPEQWRATAEQRTGSWWDDYRDWVCQHAGELKPAPQELGSEQFPAGTPAPGTYVFEP